MKPSQLLLLLYLVFPICVISQSPENKQSLAAKGQDKRIEIRFSHNSTFDDLYTIKADLSSKNIALTFYKLNFDESGKLKYISFHVDCSDGFSGSAKGAVKPGVALGFFRDYGVKGDSPFGAGVMLVPNH